MSGASKKLPLQEWYVISLRPLHQHGGVRRRAAAMGAKTFAVSTLRLRELRAGAALDAAVHCPRVVVTSPAAVRFAQAQQPLQARAGQRWFALGGGSASALRRCGIRRVVMPDRGSDSEALLAHDALQQLQGQCVGIITAPGGRDTLLQGLLARGAQPVIAHVYRREPLPLGPARLRALAALPATSALMLTSAEAFSLLWSTLDASARSCLMSRPCIVASSRLAAWAGHLGFAQVLRARDASPSSMLDALAEHVGQRRFG